MSDRTALLIYCSQEEFEKIHTMAEIEHRTLSGYVLNIVMRAVTFEEAIYAGADLSRLVKRAFIKPVLLSPGPRTNMLLRCSRDEAVRIRTAAQRRQTSISGYVRMALKRSWSITDGISVTDQVSETLAAALAGSAA
jgi:uncharacterized protein (DUF1778 family)